ncbi:MULTISPECIES: zinc-binding dehydrogenase [unclassified Paenibacillus]|nr:MULTISPECIES: zinc-binding dehydrogenase [unclassified Paenibacillus]
MFRFLAEGKLNIAIGRRFPLEEAAAAHARARSRQSTGNVLLDVRAPR